MASTIRCEERRRNSRRSARGKVFVVFDQHQTKIGHLLDICRGGLCCLTENIEQLATIKEISLVAYGEGKEYSVVNCLPLYALNEQKQEKNSQVIRICFARLTDAQQRKLSAFLRLHTGSSPQTSRDASWLA